MKNLSVVRIWAAVTIAVTLAGCGGGGNTTTPPPTTYVLTVSTLNPSTGVTMTVSPADNSGSANGSATFARTYDAGTTITVTAPDKAGNSAFGSWSGCTSATTETCKVTLNASTTITASYKSTPTVTVSPALSSINTAQSLSVSVSVSGGSGNPAPSGSVTLSSGAYNSSASTLASSTATIQVPAGALAIGSDTLTASYTPDSSSSSIYGTATGSSTPVNVTRVTNLVSIDQSTPGPAVTDQLLGMNLAAWYDIGTNSSAIVNAFGQAGIKAVRWPGGSWSDIYHWQSNSNCQTAPNGGGTPDPHSTFVNFVNQIANPGGLDLALTADYGTNEACTGGGDPSEAAAWITAATADGITVSHMTVGNEEYGGWEEDLHAKPHDPATYASAVAGTSGYYNQIKAASSKTMVGIVVEDDDTVGGWDDTVLPNAKGYYDYVELHFYPQGPGNESDSYLVQQAAQDLTKDINILKSELASVGEPNTPIYVGEIGSVYTNPGKQSMSITQGLYAGQVLGEMMNDGIARATWWIGFGNCNGTYGNISSSLYGWQNFGAYNVFADGPTDTGCAGAGPIGTMSPTARAFQLFSKIAVTGEAVLSATVTGDTTNIRAYAATHSGGTALVLFNLSESVSQPVVVNFSTQSTSSDVSIETYSKALYDQSQSNVWAKPTTTDLGAQSLPITLTLDSWSMNVVIIK